MLISGHHSLSIIPLEVLCRQIVLVVGVLGLKPIYWFCGSYQVKIIIYVLTFFFQYLKKVQWLPIEKHMLFKHKLLVFKVTKMSEPSYICSFNKSRSLMGLSEEIAFQFLQINLISSDDFI